MPHFLGLDIGGANLKAAHADGHAISRPFPVWKHPERLSAELADLIDRFPAPDHVAVTMTAELADCFQTKAEGVDRILTAVESAVRGVPVHVWTTGAEFLSLDEAREFPMLAAAANWHAQAMWAGRMAPAGLTLLIDVGSTTTDIIPLVDGFLDPRGLTDSERLLAGELVYTGARRTPLCAVSPTVPFRGQNCPVAAELFATTLDVYLTRENIAEDVDNRETANGRPATKAAAHDRLARMVCCDVTEFSEDDALRVAEYLASAQRELIGRAIERVLEGRSEPAERVILSGSGDFLGAAAVQTHSRLQGTEIVRLRSMLVPEIVDAACAFAVARLAMERIF